MRDTIISLSQPDISDAEIGEVVRVMQSGRLSLGPELEAFEAEFAALLGVRYAVAVSSGTAALHCILKSLGIGEGDEVITSPFSFIASANCMLFERALPVFIDIDPNTFCLDPASIEAKINSRTKAILPVHLTGMSCDMKAIMAIAKKHGLYVIEDACEAIGATSEGEMVGSIGKAGAFAFYPNKQMTTGEGGMVVTNDEKMALDCKSLRNQGRAAGKNFDFDRLGYNYRLNEIQAAIGRVQVQRLPELLAKRRQVANWYTEALKDFDGVILPPGVDREDNSWFIFLIQIAQCEKATDREALRERLREEGIETASYFPPIHLQSFYREQFGFKEGDFPITEKIAKRTLALPFHTKLNAEDVQFVAQKLISFIQEME